MFNMNKFLAKMIYRPEGRDNEDGNDEDES